MLKTFLGIIVAFLPFSFIACSSNNDQIQKIEVKIINVHDGDTITTNNGEKIRLIGVDTPEMNNQYHNFAPTTGIERMYAEEATNFLREKILNKNILLIKEGHDKYNRTLGVIQFSDNNDFIEVDLVREGLARVAYFDDKTLNSYQPLNFILYKQLLLAQYEAKSKQKGVWLHEKEFNTIFPKAR